MPSTETQKELDDVLHYSERVGTKTPENNPLKRAKDMIFQPAATWQAIAEEEGISLQLSGHTHGGQLPPFSWITSRVYGKYVHGLQRFGKMQVFTNWGAGTWGPPMRLGTQPEIVLIQFE